MDISESEIRGGFGEFKLCFLIALVSGGSEGERIIAVIVYLNEQQCLDWIRG